MLHKAAQADRQILRAERQTLGADVGSLAELQVYNATLFEVGNNTLKRVGDQCLARLYRLVNLRFHLDEWDARILHKLETLESIYEKISNQASTRRMEVLEWVIIPDHVLDRFGIYLTRRTRCASEIEIPTVKK